jgi:hypothetical protein
MIHLISMPGGIELIVLLIVIAVLLFGLFGRKILKGK